MFFEYSIKDIHSLIETDQLGVRCIVEEAINKYEKYNKDFHAWVCFDPDQLIRGAQSLQKRLNNKELLRPLDGIPIGIKDIFNTIDFPTEMGSPIWKGFTSGNDARVVYYLKNSGGLVAGKTVTAEFAVHEINETLNPHNINLTPGTSSSGSAVAVSLGIVPVAIGTQTAASIIRPASFCGIYGYKPSFGLIPRTGSLKTTDSLDTIGYFVAKPIDLRRIFDIMRVRGPNFPVSNAALKNQLRQKKPLERPWKIALIRTHTWEQAPDYARQSLINFAHKISNYPDIELTELYLPPEFNQIHKVHTTIYNKSLSYYFSEESLQISKISKVMANMIEAGNNVSKQDFLKAIQKQEVFINKMDNIFHNFDACISLSTSGEAPPRGIAEREDPSLMWTFLHLPAINVPAFTSPSMMPFGCQIISRKYNDYLLLDLIEYLLSIELIPGRSNEIRLPG